MHAIYVLIGKLVNYIALIWWNIKDRLDPPETDAALFVAHPDDDTLFFHTFIKEHKPYVCLMTTGWSLRRVPDFFKVMKEYGVRYRVYPCEPTEYRAKLMEKHVKKVLGLGHFSIVAAHNSTGEYGHEGHVKVHEAVLNVLKREYPDARLFCPVGLEEIEKYPLPENEIQEKMKIFKDIYVTESWVPFEEEAGTPRWVTHEQLEEIQK